MVSMRPVKSVGRFNVVLKNESFVVLYIGLLILECYDLLATPQVELAISAMAIDSAAGLLLFLLLF